MSMYNEVIIPLLLSIIAFWLVRYIQRSDKRFDYFSEKVEELTQKITIIITKYDDQKQICGTHKESINKRFDLLTDAFDNHEKRIDNLENNK